MATRTITTTAAEDEAITYAYQQAQKGTGPAGPPPPVETEAQYFDRMVHNSTLSPMTFQHAQAKNTEFLNSYATVPEANRPAAQADIEAAITAHGGTVPVQKLTYQWSANTATPPRVNSIEIDATEANFGSLSKITFDDLDAGGVSRMTSLLATKINTLIRLEDAANAANFLQVLTMAAPIQRQGADGFVEISAKFHSKGGSFAGLDGRPLSVTFI